MSHQATFVVPDFCKNSSVLMLVLLTELFSIVLTLIKYEEAFFAHLGSVSLYFQWCALLSCGLLCLLRSKLNASKGLWPLFGAFACCFFPFLIIELGAQWVFSEYQNEFRTTQFISRSISVLIIVMLILRFFSLMSLLELRNKAEMNQRILALQSRIRPHFLFNSLNTISELTHIDAKKAEDAINSLSLLFRASLENERRFHSLDNEISLCKRYIQLERWRLGAKLNVEWVELVKDTQKIETPKLILQPLIENAILHGVQTTGEISLGIDIRDTGSHVSFMISNIKGSGSNEVGGHGIAVDNIKERLFVLYDDQQVFRIKETSTNYSVIVRFPKKLITAKRV